MVKLKICAPMAYKKRLHHKVCKSVKCLTSPLTSVKIDG